MIKIKFSKKGLYIIISFIIATFLFFSFVYLPKVRQLRKIEARLENVQPELKDMEERSSKDVDLSVFMGGLKERVKFLNGKFPPSEEEAIKDMSKLASRYGLEVVSIKNSVENLDPKKEAFMSIPGKKVKKAYLDIYILGDYLQLGRFLQKVREEFKNFVALDKLHIEKLPGKNRLEIQIKFFLYLIV